VTPENRVAMYDAPANRIIINLAAVDPDNMLSAQQVIQEAAFHEGLHNLLVRDKLDGAEIRTLSENARTLVVPEEYDAVAHQSGLTWFDRSLLRNSDTNLNELDIEEEAIIDLMTALTQNKVPEVRERRDKKLLGAVQADLTRFIQGIIGAAQDSDIVELVKVFNRIRSGSVGKRGPGYLGEPGEASPGSIRSARLIRYANPAEVDDLKAAITIRDESWSESGRLAAQAEVDKIADKIVSRRTRIQESAPPTPSMPEALKNIKEKMESIERTPGSEVPLLNKNTGSTAAYREALDEFLRIRGGATGYTMPADIKYFYEQQSGLNEEGRELVDRLTANGTLAEVKGDSARNVVEKGLGKNTILGSEETAEGTVKEIKATLTDNLRYLYLDRRQWVAKQTDRLLAEQNMAMIDAETSALVAWRNADSAVNWLPSLMTLGPLRYTGTGGSAGSFENEPIFSETLKRKWGGDGRVEGLNPIFKLIEHTDAHKLANAYGQVKRIQSKQETFDRISNIVNRTPTNLRTTELDNRFRRAKKELENAKTWVNFSEGEMKQIVRSVEGGTVTDKNGRVIRRGGHANIEEFWDRYQAFNKEMIKMTHDVGLITTETMEHWLQQDYMPFYSDTGMAENFPVGSAEEISRRGQDIVLKALRGAELP